MIDMHAHWRPAEVSDALRARAREPLVTRNKDGVEVVKSRTGEELLSDAFDSAESYLARMDQHGVTKIALSLLGSFCWIESQPLETSVALCQQVNAGSPGSSSRIRTASSRMPRCRWRASRLLRTSSNAR